MVVQKPSLNTNAMTMTPKKSMSKMNIYVALRKSCFCAIKVTDILYQYKPAECKPECFISKFTKNFDNCSRRSQNINISKYNLLGELRY